ncbi:HlyD family efflux transporter periplasmic adaptor subunit [Streptomyces albidoflavus]
MRFRQQALTKLQSPEQLDLPVRFARPQGLLVLAVTLVVMAAGGVWAVTGSVATTLTAPGVLTHAQGSYVVQSTVSGQVTAVRTAEGRRVARGTPLLTVRTARGDVTIRALAAGRVTALAAATGAVVTTGSDLAAVERQENPDDPLLAVLYAPADRGASLRPGAKVDLTVQSVPAQSYGVLRGTVKSVGRTARTRQQISAELGSTQLGEEFSRNGPPIAVEVRLHPTKSTRSGYTWSTSDGPPHPLTTLTLVDGAVHLDEQRPADWLLP